MNDDIFSPVTPTNKTKWRDRRKAGALNAKEKGDSHKLTWQKKIKSDVIIAKKRGRSAP